MGCKRWQRKDYGDQDWKRDQAGEDGREPRDPLAPSTLISVSASLRELHMLPADSLLGRKRGNVAASKLPGYNGAQAVAELGARDAKLRRLMERAGPFTLTLASTQSPFEALVRSIIYQQLHGKAAAAIHLKLLASFADVVALENENTGGLKAGTHPTAVHLLECPNEQLRMAGLSHNKALALRDLAAKTVDGTVPTMRKIRTMDDEAIIEHLTQVRGIGRWTVEMFLMFRLGRPDVLPVSDYGVRKGFALTYLGLKPQTKVTPDLLPKPDVMEKQAKKWHPWCSVASWYMWRACDLADRDKRPA